MVFVHVGLTCRWLGPWWSLDPDVSWLMDLFPSLSHDAGWSHHTSHYICGPCCSSHLCGHMQRPMIILTVPRISTSCFCSGHRAKMLPCIQHTCQILQSKTVDRVAGYCDVAAFQKFTSVHGPYQFTRKSQTSKPELKNPSTLTQPRGPS